MLGRKVVPVNVKSSRKKNLKFEAEQLRDLHWTRNLSMAEIGRRHGVTHNAIRYWLKKYGIAHRSTINVLDLSGSPVLSYLLGVYFGDGCVHCCNGVWRFRLSVTDLAFAQSVCRALRILGTKASLTPIEPQKDGYKPTFLVSAGVKMLGEYLGDKGDRTLIEVGMAWPLDFLRGLYESEGSYMFRRGRPSIVAFCTTNRALLDKPLRFMKDSFLFPSVSKCTLPSGKRFFRVSIFSNVGVRKFMSHVNPCIKISPRQDVDIETNVGGAIS